MEKNYKIQYKDRIVTVQKTKLFRKFLFAFCSLTTTPRVGIVTNKSLKAIALDLGVKPTDLTLGTKSLFGKEYLVIILTDTEYDTRV